MKKPKVLNLGGVNGLGEALVNTNSREFLELKAMIQKHAANLPEEERMQNAFLAIRFEMEAYLNHPEAAVIPAGAFLEKFLDAVSVKKKDFARYVGMEESNLSALLKGRRKINAELAIKLGQIFKVEPSIWLYIESRNALTLEVQERNVPYGKFSLDGLFAAVED